MNHVETNKKHIFQGNYDVVIVGGGIAGLYTLLRVSEAMPDARILLLEATHHLGGTVQTIYDPQDGHPLYEATAWQIISSHVRHLSLMERCGLPVLKMPHTLIRDDCSPMDSRQQGEFYINGVSASLYAPGGMSSLVGRLVELASSDGSVFTSTIVQDVRHLHTGGFQIRVSHHGVVGTVHTRQVVCCCPPNVIRNWSIANHANHSTVLPSFFDFFAPVDYLKVVVRREHPQPYQGLHDFYILSSGIFSRCITSPTDPHFLYLSYEHGDAAKELYHLWTEFSEEFERQVRNRWHCLFPTEPFPLSEDIALFFTPSRVFEPIRPMGGDGREIQRFSNPQPGLYLVGAHLSNHPGHIEGVLESVDNVLETLLPASTWAQRPVQSVLSFGNLNADLRGRFRFILNQSGAASCVANACASLLYSAMEKVGFPPFLPSVLFIYYNTRLIMGVVDKDFGSFYDALVEALDTYGVCPENMWPFDISRVRERPPEECYQVAREMPFRISVVPVGLNSKTTPTALILRHIQTHLLNDHPIMMSMCRHPRQRITQQGKLIIVDLDHSEVPIFPSPHMPPPTHFHSVLLVGIDFQRQCFILLNSYGLGGGVDGFFRISFDTGIHDGVLIFEEMFTMHIDVVCPVVSPPVLACLQWQDQMHVSSQHHKADCSISPCRTAQSWLTFDHVVIGAGITGSYLAHRLQSRFPDDSILVLDPRFGDHSSIDQARLCDPDIYEVCSHLYRIDATFTPRTFQLFLDAGVPTDRLRDDLTLNRTPDAISTRVWDALAEFMDTTDPLSAWTDLDARLSYMKEPRFFTTTAHEFLTHHVKLSLTEQRHLCEQFLDTHPMFFEDMSIFHFIGCCLPAIAGARVSWQYPANVVRVYAHLRGGFEHVAFGDWTGARTTPHRHVLCGASCTAIEDQQIVMALPDRGSDGLRVGFRECYVCSSDACNTYANPQVFEWTEKSRVTLFLRYDASDDDTPTPMDAASRDRYDRSWGRCFLLSSHVMQCNMTNPGVHNRLRRAKPLFVRDAVLYPMVAWEELDALARTHPPWPGRHPVQFMIFESSSDRLCQVVPADGSRHDEVSLWRIMLDQLGVGGTVHRLNTNFSPLFYYVEGSLEMVDTLLDQLRVVGA